MKISDIYKGLGFPQLNSSVLPPNFSQVTRTLPNGTGTYQSPVTTQQTAPTALPTVPVVQTKNTPVVQTSVTPQGLDYSKYTDPATGKVMSPTEYADFLAKRVTGGSVPTYAGNAIVQGPQSTAQLTSTATDLNNQKNDIATGTTDPYKVASASGIAYSPNELTAIEKAYAGIYDPALKDVFSKLDVKQRQDASDLASKQKLAEMAQQHKYDLELKFGSGGGTGGVSGTYVPGANPTVDGWAQRIYDGNSKITDIPASDKGLRNAVTVALNANGNQANGKPTTSSLGIQALQTANDLLGKFNSGSGTSAVGASRLFGYGAFPPPGTDASNFTNDFNTLKSQLSLDAVKYLKGQGAVSDAERALLASAVTKLNLTQSEDEFKKTLQGIIDTLKGGTISSTGNGFDVTDPDGGVHTFPTQAAADEFEKAIKKP